MSRQLAEETPPGTKTALVVLGCRVLSGAPSPALRRRLERAVGALEEARAWRDEPAPELVIMSGGKNWQGVQEASAMAAWWKEHGPARCEISTEVESMTTRGNAHFTAALCRQRGISQVLLVTCDYHMPRARSLFLAQGLRVRVAPSQSSSRLRTRIRLELREVGARLLQKWESLPR